MFKYGKTYDKERFKEACIRQGIHLIKLNRMPQGRITGLDNSEICDIDCPVFSTVTARYYKGIGTHKDNIVMEVHLEVDCIHAREKPR